MDGFRLDEWLSARVSRFLGIPDTPPDTDPPAVLGIGPDTDTDHHTGALHA